MPRVALIHEWLTTFGGSELVLKEWLRCFPGAEVFTLVDRMAPEHRAIIGVDGAKKIHTSFLDALPRVERYYRKLLPLFPLAVRGYDLRGFDVVISNSHSVAQGVRTHPGQVHLSYCLSPMRYAWDLREQYLEEVGLAGGLSGTAARWTLDRLKGWDRRAATRVDRFATLSHYVAERIARAYGREAEVIYPPVDTEFFTPGDGGRADETYFAMSRFVPYKRMDRIVAAFRLLPGRRLVLAGDGPEREKVLAGAGRNVEWIGACSREEAREQMRRCRAFLFAADEDFGIAPVEAQACGAPVIAYGQGGSLETVVPGVTGRFFAEQTPESIAQAIQEFEAGPRLVPAASRQQALGFSADRFRREFMAFVDGPGAASFRVSEERPSGGANASV